MKDWSKNCTLRRNQYSQEEVPLTSNQKANQNQNEAPLLPLHFGVIQKLRVFQVLTRVWGN